MKKAAIYSLLPILLITVVSCSQNKKPSNEEVFMQNVDTITVDKYKVNEIGKLQDWVVYELGYDTVCLPKSWSYNTIEEEFIVRPSKESLEEFRFSRIYKDSLAMQAEEYAKNRYRSKLEMLGAPENNGLTKTGYSDNASIYGTDFQYKKLGETYRGYFMIFDYGKYFYEIQFLITETREIIYQKDNGSDFLSDVLCNIRFNGQLICDGKRPPQKIIKLESASKNYTE